jgi:hypothetical protein
VGALGGGLRERPSTGQRAKGQEEAPLVVFLVVLRMDRVTAAVHRQLVAVVVAVVEVVVEMKRAAVAVPPTPQRRRDVQTPQ